MENRPFVSLIVPARNEEGHLEECLQGLLAQSYPSDRIELLVVDGESDDRTRDIAESLAKADPRIRVLANPERIQSAGLNLGIRAASGDILIRADVHAEYAPDFVASCVDVLGETGADNAGGAARVRAKTPFQTALAAALRSPLGVGGSKYRSEENEGSVESVWPGAFPRSTFERFGLFDRHAVTNEDAELNFRITSGGGRVHLSRRIVAYYYPRRSFRALAEQYYKYGQGRARTLLRHRELPSLRPMIPFFAVVSGGLLLLTSPIQPLTPFAVGAYAVAALGEAARVRGGLGWAEVPRIAAMFPVMHAAHGIGFAAGLVKFGSSREPAVVEYLEPREASRVARAGTSPATEASASAVPLRRAV